MKLSIFLILIVCLQGKANKLSAQSITFSGSNVALPEAFSAIKKQTSYLISFFKEDLKDAKVITINVVNMPVEQFLNICLKNQPLDFRIVGQSIFITRKTVSKVDEMQIGVHASVPNPSDIHGRVFDESGKPVSGVNVTIKNTNMGTATDENGEFILKSDSRNVVLVFTSVNMERFEFKVNGQAEINVTLKNKLSELGSVSVELNTGYERIPKERATGSFENVDNKLINRTVTTNILDRIENLVPGVLFNHGDAVGLDQYLIRGRSTIFSNSQPLIVLDNFPYEGSLSNINPNDIESISVLKDAAAASIWGARSGNGVIVITTKKGKSNRSQINVTSSITVQQKPDLSNIRMVSPSDFIDLEKYLYATGHYKTILTSPSVTYKSQPVTPVVSLLQAVDSGTISSDAANAQIDQFRHQDVRKDLLKYNYRLPTNQQYSVSMSGSSGSLNYYLSTGWDHNLPAPLGTQYDRISFRSNNSFKVSNNIDFLAGLSYMNSETKSGNNPAASLLSTGFPFDLYPYAKLVDVNGNPQPIYLNYRQQFIQKEQSLGFQDWSYNPLKDIYNETNSTTTKDFLASTGLRIKILRILSADLKYQYEDQNQLNTYYHNDSSYFTRNLINQYAQVNSSTGAVLSHPLPLGGIMTGSSSELKSHHGRVQLNLDTRLGERHSVSAIAGYEITSSVSTGISYQYYGYEPGFSQTQTAVDYLTNYTLQPFNSTGRIPNAGGIFKLTDHYLSSFANVAYTFNDRYLVSASAREDQANLFGVHANQKGVPLWHVGGGYILSKEKFYNLDWLPFLKVRVTYGYNGNFSRKTSALTTISSSPNLTTSAVASSINNPPNENLQWEKDKQINYGLDFVAKRGIISGSVEYYNKKGTGLMGQSPIDPTLGLGNGSQSFFFGNVADMRGSGWDISINTKNIDTKVKWTSNIVFSYSVSTVTKYLMPVSSSGSTYLTLGSNSINPVVGKPVFSMYSFRWAGLDPATGDPQGYLGKQSSKNYASIYAQTSLDSMVYNGPVEPTYFGAVRNTINYFGFSLSFNVTYKFGYYFRRQSVNYASLINSWNGNSDYSKRWQKPGDEKTTDIPSMPSNVNSLDPKRDAFFAYSSLLVERADNVRLQDLVISYDWSLKHSSNYSLKGLKFSVIGSNMGVIWLKNKEKIDPYYNNTVKDGKSIAIRIDASF